MCLCDFLFFSWKYLEDKHYNSYLEKESSRSTLSPEIILRKLQRDFCHSGRKETNEYNFLNIHGATKNIIEPKTTEKIIRPK